MAYTRVPQRRASLLERWARTAYRWRWRVLGAWVLVLAGLTAANFLLGGTFVQQHENPSFGSEYIGIIVAILILLVAFGSVIAMGLPLAAAIFGLGAGFAAIGLAANLAKFPDFSPQFAAMIGLGVGID